MAKRKQSSRNISGLRNQKKAEGSLEPHGTDHIEIDEDSDSDWEPGTMHDSLHLMWNEDVEGEESDIDLGGPDLFDDEIAEAAFTDWLAELAKTLGDDPRDEDWVPAELQRKRLKRAQEPKKG